MKTLVRHYRVDRRQIAFLRFIIEAYDGAAGLTTVDPAQGIVRICIAPGCQPLIDSLLAHLGTQMVMAPLTSFPDTKDNHLRDGS
jgi:hypothetical protein